MPEATRNILTALPKPSGQEIFETLATLPGARIERIISHGQSTPDGQWYDQAWDEWVLVLSGRAELQIETEASPRVLATGDYLLLPAGCRHRVAWTDPDQATVWLAIHFNTPNLVPNSGD